MRITSNLNQHNQSYYANHGTTNVPNLLATAAPIQEAIRLFIESTIPTDPIKVIELGFGSRIDRYAHISKHTGRKWDVTLSDFSLSVLPPILPLPNVTLHTLELDLLLKPIPSGFDVILSTYTFDSIEFPEDKFEDGRHYPGGLVKVALQSIKHVRNPGIFITIDKISQNPTVMNQNAAGAKFKTLDLRIAATELNATLMSLNDFLSINNQHIPIDLSDHGCLIINT